LTASQLSESLSATLGSLVSQGFTTVLIVASDFNDPIIMPKELIGKVTILRRPNSGYDFGSWAIGNQMIPGAKYANEVLLMNDSLHFNSSKSFQFAEAVRTSSNSPFDVTSITDSLLHSYHLQSYCLHFKNGSFGTSSVQNFFMQVRPQLDRDAVIFAYEIGFSSMARNSQLTIGAIYPFNAFRNERGNASIHSWFELMNFGWPFIKKEVFKSKSKKECEKLFTDLEKNSNFNSIVLDSIRSDLGIS